MGQERDAYERGNIDAARVLRRTIDRLERDNRRLRLALDQWDEDIDSILAHLAANSTPNAINMCTHSQRTIVHIRNALSGEA